MMPRYGFFDLLGNAMPRVEAVARRSSSIRRAMKSVMGESYRLTII